MTERDSETRAREKRSAETRRTGPGNGEDSSLSINFELEKKSTNEIDFAYMGLFCSVTESNGASQTIIAREHNQRRSIDGVRN